MADKDAAFAVVLGLFAIEGKGDVVAEIGERGGGGNREWHTLIRWPKDQVAAQVVAKHSGGVGPTQATDRGAGAELASVDEVGRAPARLEGKVAKAQDLVTDEQIDEGRLIGFHGRARVAKKMPLRAAERGRG